MSKVKTRRLTVSSNTRLVGKVLKTTGIVVFSTVWFYTLYHIVFIYQSNFQYKTRNNKDMNRKQEIKDKMREVESFYCISIDQELKLTIPVFGETGPTHGVVTLYRDSIEELVEDISNYSYKASKYGSPYGNQTCKWN